MLQILCIKLIQLYRFMFILDIFYTKHALLMKKWQTNLKKFSSVLETWKHVLSTREFDLFYKNTFLLLYIIQLKITPIKK